LRKILRHHPVEMRTAQKSILAEGAYIETGTSQEGDEQSVAVDRAAGGRFSQNAFSPLAELPAAIANDQLTLLYQPKIDLFTSQVAGVEALVRWRHPMHGLIEPRDFVPSLERAGIAELTRWVVNAALAQLGDWLRHDVPVKMSINVSPSDLVGQWLPDMMVSAALRHRVSLDSVCLELTESVLVEDTSQCATSMQHLAEVGVSLSLDDYGTRHSSLRYVQDLPVDELKIDRLFIDSVAKLRKSALIVHSTIELGRTLGVSVVAEGIEHEAQLTLLKRMGCEFGQGFLFSRPLSAAGFSAWLKEWPHGCARHRGAGHEQH
jgi:diguanylate cyclase